MKMKILALIAATMTTAMLWAGDTSALHPPAGNRMALIVFEDLQCPACAAAEPALEKAEHDYKIPIVRHDFLIPSHNWSPDAHIIARYFDVQSPQLGEEFRRYIFANQRAIYNQATLRQLADKFAQAHHTALPQFVDPMGRFRNEVEADTDLGKHLGEQGVRHTPTIYVVTDSPQLPPREVPETSKLFETIDQVKAALPPAPAKPLKTKTTATK
jgi:protein-disulfide isomerase